MHEHDSNKQDHTQHLKGIAAIGIVQLILLAAVVAVCVFGLYLKT